LLNVIKFNFLGSTLNSKNSPSTGSSDYNSCSDNPVEIVNVKKEKLNESLQSVILAGQIQPCCHEIALDESVLNLPNNRISNESNYSVNVLDQNIDIFMEDNDTFMDCKDLCQADSNVDESTKYLQFESVSKLSKIKSSNLFSDNYTNLHKLNNTIEINESNDSLLDPIKSNTENERLITIMEETEVTHASNSIRMNRSSVNLGNISRNCDFKIPTQHNYDKINNPNKYSMKRVLFANENDKLKETKAKQFSNLQVSKAKCCARKERNIDENCNNHNTTESFVLWEKACKTSDKLLNRRSRSFSELTNISDSYTGDDEYSTSFKTLDNTFISDFGIDTNDKSVSQKKSLVQRSKSCDSLLREVKHLPHLLYDKFLKCFVKEIENIRRQNIVCTCPNLNEKYSNKENILRSSKYNKISPRIKISNEKVESKFLF
jgi:hypothetical protein